MCVCVCVCVCNVEGDRPSILTLTPKSHPHTLTCPHPHLPILGPLRPVQLGVALIAYAKVAQSYLVLGTVIAEDTTTRSIHTEQVNKLRAHVNEL